MARSPRSNRRARRTKSSSRILALLPKARRGRRLTPGIVRVDSNRTHGYVVRIGYVRSGTGARSRWRARFRAYFGDKMYGGKSRALRAAEEWIRTLTMTGKAPEK